jgi:hypothetical protein
VIIKSLYEDGYYKKLTMHQLTINEKSQTSRVTSYRSTDKENWLSQRTPTPQKLKANIYYQKLMEMEKKYAAEADRNSRKL